MRHIANKPISRAAAQLIIEQARDDVVDMRVETAAAVKAAREGRSRGGVSFSAAHAESS